MSTRPKDKHAARTARKLKVIYGEVDQAIERTKLRMDISCKEGCSHCCHLNVAMSIPEGLTILDYLSKDRIRWKIFTDSLSLLAEQATELSDHNMTREEWFEKQIPCVFLKEGACSIYEVRPTACRTHNSIDDPYLCSHEAGLGAQYRSIDFGELDDAVWNEGMLMMSRNKLPLGYAPLPAVMLWAHIYWTRGRRGFMDAIKGMPLSVSDLANLKSWLHLVRTDKGYDEMQVVLNEKSESG